MHKVLLKSMKRKGGEEEFHLGDRHKDERIILKQANY